MLPQCEWAARRGGDVARSRPNLMSNAFVIDNLIQDCEMAAIPNFVKESFYYLSGIHSSGGFRCGLTLKMSDWLG